MRESDVPTAGQLATMWWSKYNEFQTTRLRVRDCRDWLNNRWDPVVPKDFAQVAGNLAIKLPYAVTVPLHAVQMLSSKRPRLRRDPMGKSITARTNASDLEVWANSAISAIEEQHGPFWRPLCDMLFNQGSAAVLCFPASAGWENMPSFVDEDGGVYRQWQADGKSMKQSRASYEDYLLDWRARQVPIAIRVVGVDQCLPILGPGHRLDGLIVRSQYSQEELEARGYRWRFGDGGHVGTGYDPDYASQSRGYYPKFTLYELWRPGSVVYYIGQGVTAPAHDGSNMTLAHRINAGGETNLAAVDLARDFGITRLCGTWVWGCNFASETDPDRRGVPFLWPFLSVFQGMNNLATAKLAHTWQHAFGGWFIPANADVSPDLVLENGRPREIDIQPMKAQYVAGNPVPATHPGTNKDVDELMGLMLGSVHEEAPSSAAGGGPGATSGHDRALIRSMLQDAYDDVLNGGLQAMTFVGSMVTEIADCIVEHYGVTVPVYCSVQPKGMRQSVRQAQELTQDMCQGVYDFWCEYPPEEGENLPYAQMLMQWSIEGRIPLRQALEKGLGDESPDETMIEIQTEKLLFQTPQGQQYLFQLVGKKLDDEKMAQLFAAVQGGQAMPDGTPTAALPGNGAPPGPTGQLAGVQTPNPVNSAVGGIVQGALGAGPMRRDVLASQQAGAIVGPGAAAPPGG
jgi:hypothetical protein